MVITPSQKEATLILLKLVLGFGGKLYLYGSQANGKATADSDVDLMAVFPSYSQVSADKIGSLNLESLNISLLTITESSLLSDESPFYLSVKRDMVLLTPNSVNTWTTI